MKDNGMMLSIAKFIHAVLIAASICFLATAVKSQPLGGMPNIIFFISDDMGWGDSLVYNPDSQIPMPSLEQLAAEGMRFTDAHSFSHCWPTRYSAMTGNYPWRNAAPPTDLYRGGSLIPSSQRTVANVLQDSGYNTAMFGKIHLGGDFYRKGSDEFISRGEPEDSIDFARGFQNGPLTYGFNHSYVLLRGIQDSPFAYFEDDQLVGDPNDLMIWAIGPYGDSYVVHEGIGMPYWDSSEVGPILTQKAIEFIDRHHQQNLTAGTNTPFFVYYAAQSAHSPNTPPNSFHGKPVKGVRMDRRADMVYEIDLALGKLVEAVRERGLIGNTLIIFTSDNGIAVLGQIQSGHDSVGGLRGQKSEVWEGGHRVPFVAKWGDGTAEGSVIPPGTISNQLIGVQDVTATLAAVVGQELPNDQALDSFNFLPVLLGLGNDDAPVRDHLINEGGQVNGVSNPARAFREGQWKLIVDFGYNVTGLYDLANDLRETTNLMDDPSQAVRIENMRERFVQLINAAHTREMPECSDGIDNDGDGHVDFPADPGCPDAAGALEDPECEDGLDNDGDGRIDWDGAGVGVADLQCLGEGWRNRERRNVCGLGVELVLALPALLALRARTRTARGRGRRTRGRAAAPGRAPGAGLPLF